MDFKFCYLLCFVYSLGNDDYLFEGGSTIILFSVF